jgi:hypothetical protein
MIDMVYTYVDGTDRIIVDKRNKYLKKQDIEYNPNIRFESINEIVLSIETILKFAKWINTIYIVSDMLKHKYHLYVRNSSHPEK